MVRYSLFSSRIYAALGLTLAGFAVLPATAQNLSGSDNLVARQPAAIDAAVARWEVLQASRTHTFADYAGFVLANPTFPRADILRLRAEAALENEAPPQAELLRYFDANPPLTNPGRARYALALAAMQHPKAFEEARRAWRGGAMSDPVELYIAGLYGAQFTPEDHAVRMDALLWQGKGDAASRQLVNLSEPDRQLAMARLSLVRGARPEMSGLAVPAGAEAEPGYTFNLVKFLRSTGQSGEAARVFTNRPGFNRPALDPEAFVGELLSLAKATGARDAAMIAARTDDLFAPGTDVSLMSFTLRDRYTDLMWLGGTRALWDMGDGTTAAPLFQRYGDAAKTPLTKAKGYFWAGRAARQAGNGADAARYFEMAARWPEYYYGQLALSELGRSMPSFAGLPQPAMDPSVRAEFESRPLVKAIRALAVSRRDWRTERRFFEALGDEADTPTEMLMAAMLANEVGLDEMAVVLGMKAGENGLSSLERIGFPVVATPPAVNDWVMVHAIARQESEFDRTRESHAGARGIMQLMPGTAREQAGKLGMQYLSADLTGAPQYNITLGDAYFARMMNYYGGAYPLAVGAYNAGPGRVNEWLRLNGDPRRGEIDWVTWVEKIPANFETRYYIMRVIGNAVTYSHMYPDRAGLPRPVDTFLR
ncbi:soluble lytic murein transglycosylase [Erythromicrobium ramosum]|uniref:Soluble lytic murein transglycosylase n=1 Tax=Erythrobacter ramosus TaxID=35811 RepID=A0A6I4UN07_9SPHN|nr:lytic transglycosylase domain-containing protein [Erythrobacter ramosus]MBB3775742.1 soluble lytic murein transglycosylase [Erythrobacter ramosus]MXP39164.1 transglycosylase SLT domain-containing protein [Erythrobacter ramosus]